MTAMPPAATLLGERARRLVDLVEAHGNKVSPYARRVLLAWLADRFPSVGLPVWTDSALLLADHYTGLGNDAYYDTFRRVLARLDLEGLR